jgi:CrcB protein
MLTRDAYFETISVSCFAFFGTALRIACNSIANAVGDFIFVAVLCNIVGCFLYGIAVHVHSGWRKTLMFGFRSGFCGCVTTFSSWTDAVAASWASDHVDTGLLQLFAGLSLSIESYRLGSYVGDWLTQRARVRYASNELQADGKYRRLRWFTPVDALYESPPPREHWFTSITATLCFAFLFPVLILVTLALIFESSQVPWSILISPVGANIRFWLSKLNRHFPRFPLMTFAVNVVGTLVLALVDVYRMRQSDTAVEMISAPSECELVTAVRFECCCLSAQFWPTAFAAHSQQCPRLWLRSVV